MAKTRILFVHHTGELSGASISLSNLISELDTKKYEPILLTLYDGPVVQLFESVGAQVIVSPYFAKAYHGTTVSGISLSRYVRNNLAFIPSVISAYRLVTEIKPDILHLNTTCLFAFALGAKISPLSCKVITHVREPLLSGIAGKVLKYMNYWFTDYDISICRYDQSRLVQRNNAAVVYNSVDFSKCEDTNPAAIKKEFSIYDDEIIVTYIARVAPSNGTLEAVRYAKSFTDSYPEHKVRFLFIGFPETSSPYIDNVRTQAANCNTIHLISFRADIPDILSATNIHLCPFTEPHFSRGIIEASAAGVPSLGNNIGGVNELIIPEETGVLYNNSCESFNNALFELVNNPQKRKTMGIAAEKYARISFDAKKNGTRIMQIYDEITNATAAQ